MSNTNRTTQRENAFLVFYSNIFIHGDQTILLKKSEVLEILHSIKPEESVDSFFYELLEKTITHIENLKNKIQPCLKGWRLERLAKIDCSLLMLGATEFFYLDQTTPLPVICNEYVELAKKYGHVDSPTFVNATLEAISKLK